MSPPLSDQLLVALDRRETRVAAGLAAAPVMLDRFEVQRRVGAGGMGAVFEAIDSELGRRVALKICKVDRPGAAKAIEHEARCLAKLAHPNVVAVYEVVVVGPDVVLVMEFVRGRTLRQWQRDANPTWRELLACYVEAGLGLAAVHAAGLEHGDFKPDNVMVGDDGRVRVVDFGIARYSTSEGLAGNVGTRGYMAPERLMDQPGGPPADVFAFCVSAWESLFGALPFVGRTVHELLASIEAGTPAIGRALPGVPERVADVLAAGLSARASERPASMEVLLRALADAIVGHRRRVARAWRWIGVGLVAVLVVASVVMAAMLASVSEAPELGAVEQTLVLAQDEARDGDPDAAVQLLEAARSLARRDGDLDALRGVARAATRVGERLAERGHVAQAFFSWAVAQDIHVELNDHEAIERLRETSERATRR
ncbi:serine/threonine-protein kinase [Nannocystaceae bacterium ST9]